MRTLADLLQVEDDLLTRNSELMESISSMENEILKPQLEIISVKCETDEKGQFHFTYKRRLKITIQMQYVTYTTPC